jgi:hypothetical protein
MNPPETGKSRSPLVLLVLPVIAALAVSATPDCRASTGILQDGSSYGYNLGIVSAAFDYCEKLRHLDV